MTQGGSGPVLVELVEAGSLTGLSEAQLLRRYLASGDGRAFGVLVERHAPTVLGVCRRLLRDPRDVEDAFQATFLILVRKAPLIREPARLGPWLYGVAYRVAVRARAGAARRNAREAVRPDLDPEAPRADPDRDDLRSVFDEELGALPEKYRAPVVLCHLEGRTHDEAAAHLGWPVGTVRSRLSRARDRLRARLERRGCAPLVALPGPPWPTPEVPPALVRRTIETTTRTSMVKAITAATASGPVAALTEGVLTAMWISKMKLVALGVLCASALGTGSVLLGQSKPSRSAGLSLVPQGEEVSPPIGARSRGSGPTATHRTSPRELNVRLQIAQKKARLREERHKSGQVGLEETEEAWGEVEILKARIAESRDDLMEEREMIAFRLEAKGEELQAGKTRAAFLDKTVARSRQLAATAAISNERFEEIESKAADEKLRLGQIKAEAGELRIRLAQIDRRLSLLKGSTGTTTGPQLPALTEPLPPSPPPEKP